MKALPVNQILCGDAFQLLKDFVEESIDMVMFSPPYWGLRDYKIPKVDAPFAVGGVGLESHPKEYINRMVVLCRLLRRVLKKKGSMYITIGDTYCGYRGNDTPKNEKPEFTPKHWHRHADDIDVQNIGFKLGKVQSNWLQPKQLLLIPSRVAIALQEDGWILRNDIVWHKPNHMPSSVKDRLTNSWEHIFHFVKSRKYHYDLDAIRQPITSLGQTGWERCGKKGQFFRHGDGKGHNGLNKYYGKFEGFGKQSEAFGSPRARTQRQKETYQENDPHRMRDDKEQFMALNPERPNDLSHPSGKNPSDVIKIGMHHGSSLTKGRATHYKRQIIEDNLLGKNPSDFLIINTQPFKGAHFAVYPEKLCEVPIKASCPQKGIILDPMCGSGTTLVVAHKLGRSWIGIDLNSTYVELAKKRLESVGAFSQKLSEC